MLQTGTALKSYLWSDAICLSLAHALWLGPRGTNRLIENFPVLHDVECLQTVDSVCTVIKLNFLLLFPYLSLTLINLRDWIDHFYWYS